MVKINNKFEFIKQEQPPRQSALYDKHVQLADRSHIVPFAGFLMPLWYSSISLEHQAARQAAGLFDCTHMGVLAIEGPTAAAFLDLMTVNNVTGLSPNMAQYSYILDPAGNILDDVIIYRKSPNNFMMVVNAANNTKVQAWIQCLLNDEVELPDKVRIADKPSVRDLRDPAFGKDQKVDIALQGPGSKAIISEMLTDDAAKTQLEKLKPFAFLTTAVCGAEVIISRTGYTGASLGFEFYIHPDKAGELWDKVLSVGKTDVIPCGLGARDALRIEAGLPLYGHELAGKYNISPFEAGYGWAVKLDKQFFIGQKAMHDNQARYDKEVVRIQLPGEKGIRPVRPEDGVISQKGRCIGWVLSCTKAYEKQIALAYVDRDKTRENDTIGTYYLARNEGQKAKGKKEHLDIGDEVGPDIKGVVISRFERF